MFKQTTLGIAFFLLGLVAGMGAITKAQEWPGFTFDAGVGECRYTPAPDGQWYQKEHQNSLRMVDNCHSFGFSFRMTRDWTFGLHYVSLGSVSVEAQAVTCPLDDCGNYRDYSKDFLRLECKTQFNGDNCQYRWVSGGNAKGAHVTAAWTAFSHREIAFDLRGGLYFHQLKYQAVVENLECRDDPSCWRVAVDQVKKSAVRPTFGVGAKYRPKVLEGAYIGVTWDRFFMIGDRINSMSAGFKGDTDRTTFWIGVPL